MTFLEMLRAAETKNNSMLCVGLDPDPAKFPGKWRDHESKIYDFCAAIVDATAGLVIAFKPQIAHFAANRAEDQLEDLITYIHQNGLPVILDAKRGDIGSTAEQYAIEAFDRYGADAVTLSPFLGYDSIEPYLRREGKGAFLLCKTSNPGSGDLQDKRLLEDFPVLNNYSKARNPTVYEYIAHMANSSWNTNGQLGLVAGATFPDELKRIRVLAPNLPLLIPGIGAQGGDVVATVKAAWRQFKGVTVAPIVVNSSRAILYASSGEDFETAAYRVAKETRDQLNTAKLA